MRRGFAVMCVAASCAHGQAPDEQVEVLRNLEPRADDCEVRFIDGECSIGRVHAYSDGFVFELDCLDEPPAERLVGRVNVCMWSGDGVAELRRIACRAGADTVFREGHMTHGGCRRETDEGVQGTGRAYARLYRLDP